LGEAATISGGEEQQQQQQQRQLIRESSGGLKKTEKLIFMLETCAAITQIDVCFHFPNISQAKQLFIHLIITICASH